MTAQQKREKPEITGPEITSRAKPEPEMSGRTQPRPEMTGKGKPGTMPENPSNVDREHEPAGIDPGTDRTKER
jgi:hypothetical protein